MTQMQHHRLRRRQIAPIRRLLLAASAWTFSLAAQAQQAPPPQQVVQGLVEVLQSTAEGAAGAARLQVQQIIQGLNDWTPQAWGDVVAVSEEAGVALDTLVASVQGCLSEPDGRPIVGVPVVGQSLDTTFAPTLAITSTESLPARLLLPGGTGLTDVAPDWLSERQGQSFGPGCYWIPMPPGGLTTVFGGDSMWIVTPLVLGYEFQPGGKGISWQGSQYVVVETSNPVNPPTEPQGAD